MLICQRRAIPLYPATHTKVARVRVASHVEADLWRCCLLRRGPAQVRKVACSKASRSKPPLCKVRHLKVTSDITRVTRSRAQCRVSCNGLGERRIGDLAGIGIRRHLWWRASAVSRKCTKASLGAQGITSQWAHSESGPWLGAPSRTTELKPLSSSAASACNATSLEATRMLDLNRFITTDPRGCAAL